jgi:hypothetical protein
MTTSWSVNIGSSLNQSYHPTPIHPVKGMHDVVPVEYGQETFYRSGSVARPGLNVFPKDAPGVLDGAQDSLLVWIIHDTAQLPGTSIQD